MLHVVGHGRVDHVRGQPAGGRGQLLAAHPAEGGGPRVEGRLDVRLVDFPQEPQERVGVDRDVVVVLHGEGHPDLRRLLRRHLEPLHDHAPLDVRGDPRSLVAREDPQAARAEVPREPCRLRHVDRPDLGRGDARLLDARGEVRVGGEAGEGEPELLHPRLEACPRGRVVVERGDVRALAHELDVGEAELLRLQEERVHVEPGLAPPDAGVGDRVEDGDELARAGEAGGGEEEGREGSLQHFVLPGQWRGRSRSTGMGRPAKLTWP